MRVLYAASELFPLAKTGGLADVAAALPHALTSFGADVRPVLPGYPGALAEAQQLREAAHLDEVGSCPEARILTGVVPRSGLPIWIVDCPALFDRPGGLYQDAAGQEWPDNAVRFALFSHAVVKIAASLWPPDIVHANDWHTGLVPMLLRRLGDRRPGSVFTIHNLAYQGLFPADLLNDLGLPPDAYAAMEFHGRISFLKAGISEADLLTTVSPQYATEIVEEAHGCGLHGLLAKRSGALTGILNGVDYRVWDPRNDPYLPQPYGPGRMANKRIAKASIQLALGLAVDADRPLLVFLSRLDHQKMPDVVAEALPALLEEGAQFIMAAEGQAEYEQRFQGLSAQHPLRVQVRSYGEPLAHQMLAAADILLHPARYEPCGLVPIYAMRYGTVPVVRRIGGMVDSVSEITPETLQQNSGTGFFFDEPSAEALLVAVRQALAHYRQPIIWRKIQRAAITQDFGWARSARAYLALYTGLADPAEAGIEAAQGPGEILTA